MQMVKYIYLKFNYGQKFQNRGVVNPTGLKLNILFFDRDI